MHLRIKKHFLNRVRQHNNFMSIDAPVLYQARPNRILDGDDLFADGVNVAGSINGAIFRQFSPQPTGTSYINPFVRVQPHGAKATVEPVYNSDHRPLPFAENKSTNSTRSLPLSDVPQVAIGGTM